MLTRNKRKCKLNVKRQSKPKPFGSLPKLIRTCVPVSNIPYTPFSYCDLAKELDAFVSDVYPTLAHIADAPLFTSDLQQQFYAFLNRKAEEYIATSPYPGFSRILTVVRTDGVVVVDKTVVNPKAVMLGAVTTGGTLENVRITRQNTGHPIVYADTLAPMTNFSTLKAYFEPDGSVQKYDTFDPFSTRTEFIQANVQDYGWTTRPGIYISGQIYCVAKAVAFYGQSTITLFFRVAYNKGAAPTPAGRQLLVIQSESQQVILTKRQIESVAPGVNISGIVVDDKNVSLLDSILDTYTGKDVILNLTSQQMLDVGVDLISKYDRKQFVNCISTVDSVREETALLHNIFYMLESDSFFLPRMWTGFRGPASIQYLIIEDSPNIFLETVRASAPSAVTTYTPSQLSDPSVQAALAGATSIFICALSVDVQKLIAKQIPSSYRGVIVFVDVGPYDQSVVDLLSQTRLIATASQCASVAMLPGSSQWNLTTKPAFSNSSAPYILGLYSVIGSVGQWGPRLITPAILVNTPFGMNFNNFTINTPAVVK